MILRLMDTQRLLIMVTHMKNKYKVKIYYGNCTIPTVVYLQTKEQAEEFIEVNSRTPWEYVLEKVNEDDAE